MQNYTVQLSLIHNIRQFFFLQSLNCFFLPSSNVYYNTLSKLQLMYSNLATIDHFFIFYEKSVCSYYFVTKGELVTEKRTLTLVN